MSQSPQGPHEPHAGQPSHFENILPFDDGSATPLLDANGLDGRFLDATEAYAAREPLAEPRPEADMQRLNAELENARMQRRFDDHMRTKPIDSPIYPRTKADEEAEAFTEYHEALEAYHRTDEALQREAGERVLALYGLHPGESNGKGNEPVLYVKQLAGLREHFGGPLPIKPKRTT